MAWLDGAQMTDTSLIPTTALARELGVHRRTLARWADKGKCPLPKVFNGRLYFQRDEIEAWKKSLGNARVAKKPCLPKLPLMPIGPEGS
jgi:excisionase family DNA binding protein